MADPKLKEQLRKIITKALGPGVDISKIDDQTPLTELGGDSMAALEVITELEIQFGVMIRDQETAIKTLNSIDSLADYVEANRQK